MLGMTKLLSAIGVPGDFSYVLAVASAVGPLTFWQSLLCSKARKQAGIKYPAPYASEEGQLPLNRHIFIVSMNYDALTCPVSVLRSLQKPLVPLAPRRSTAPNVHTPTPSSLCLTSFSLSLMLVSSCLVSPPVSVPPGSSDACCTLSGTRQVTLPSVNGV